MDVVDALTGFDDGQEVDRALRDAAFALQIAHHPIDHLEVRRRLHFGQHEAVEPIADNRIDVAEAVRRIDRVDADIAHGGPRLVLLESCDHEIACRDFLGDGDRVFEIQNDRVGGQGKRLLDPPGVIARRTPAISIGP